MIYYILYISQYHTSIMLMEDFRSVILLQELSCKIKFTLYQKIGHELKNEVREHCFLVILVTHHCTICYDKIYTCKYKKNC